MNGNKAKLKFNPNNFEIIEEGDYVVCAVSGKHILLNQLTYWNVELQEAYFSPKEVQQNFDSEGLAVGDKQKLAVTWGNSKRLDSVPSTNSAVTKGCRQKKVATSYRWSFSIVVVIELVDKSIFISSGRC